METRKTLVGALALGALALSGCAALDVAASRLGDRAESMVSEYCELPRSARAIVRWETNQAVEGKGTIVLACKQDGAEYDQLRQTFVEPLSDSTIDSIIADVIERGSYELPDGSTIRLVVEEAE